MTDIYRTIDTGMITPQPLVEQPAPILDWVKVAALRIDTRYQRPLNRGNWAAIHRIASAFDWCAFGPILCAPVEGGLYAIIDGQHRAHAAAICGIEAVPAMIVPVPPRRQAQAFVKVNSGIRVDQYTTLRAEITAGDPEALAMQRAVADAGCELMQARWSNADKKPGQVFCIAAIRALIRRDMAPYLTAALRAIRAYDTTGRAALYHDILIVPLTVAASQTNCTDHDVLTAALRLKNPFVVIETADQAAKAAHKPQAAMRAAAMGKMIETAIYQGGDK